MYSAHSDPGGGGVPEVIARATGSLLRGRIGGLHVLLTQSRFSPRVVNAVSCYEKLPQFTNHTYATTDCSYRGVIRE